MNVKDESGITSRHCGDQTDGYGGVPGIGIKRAVQFFDTHGYNWETVIKAFNEKDLPEDVALLRTHAWQRSLPLMNMTYPTNASDFGPPPPITSLTMEQEFKIRQITDALKDLKHKRRTSLLSSLHSASVFVLSNNMSQLLKQWNLPPTTPEEPLKSGTSSETKN